MKNPKDYMGLSGFVWFQGVIEDRNDPLKLGRCRVRVLGFHPEDKQLVPTNHLPWAHVLQPITSTAMSGLGQTPLGPVEGTWVIGFFRDGKDAQEPIIMGLISGIPEDESVNGETKGFRDPNNVYPRTGHLKEPDTNRLARNQNTSSTIVQTKLDGIETNVNTATSGKKWSEKKTPYAAKYPFNHVRESESGHIFEVDDTSGKERLHTYHRKGTFEEIHDDGSKVVKVVANTYNIIAGSDHVLIKGKCFVTIDGDTRLLMKGDLDWEVKGDMNLTVGGNVVEAFGGTQDTTAAGNIKIVAPRMDVNP